MDKDQRGLAPDQDATISQHNELIKAVAEMDRLPLKLFEVIVGAYDGRQKDPTVKIKKDLIYDFLGVTKASRSRQLRRALTNLHQHAVFHIEHQEDDGSITHQIISPIESTNWNSRQDYVEVTFAQNLLPYISMLQDNFTQYRLADIAVLNSKHAITLYKLIAMSYNQYEYYSRQPQKLRNHDQLNSYQNPVFQLQELRKITGTEDKYVGRFSNFAKKVIEDPLAEINAHTDYSVDYEKIKSGNRVTAIRFLIKKNNITKSNDTTPKKPVDDVLYTDALNNPYTALLPANGILTLVDVMQDKELLLELTKKVYPLYAEMEKHYSKRELNRHLSYLGSHGNKQLDHEQIPNYLAKAARSQLDRLDKQTVPKRKTGKKSQHPRQIEKLPDWAQDGYEADVQPVSDEQKAKTEQLLQELRKKRQQH